jgi:regulatory protein
MADVVPLPEARKKIYRYCAYQERCHSEVKEKLYSFGLRTHQVDELLAELITEGFLNEERFARAFARGKFKLKNWGKLKIVRELEQKGLTPRCITLGLSEIEPDDYREVLIKLVRKKETAIEETNLFLKRDRIARALILKGFEPDEVWKQVKAHLPG